MNPIALGLVFCLGLGLGWLVGHYRGHTLAKLDSIEKQTLQAVTNTAQHVGDAVAPKPPPVS
jgi:hypothetical protein